MKELIASLITTQYRENYGAHDWDGTGECPQYWKNKFGTEYMIKGAPSIMDAEHFVDRFICEKSDYSDEFVVGAVDCHIEYDKRMPEHMTPVVIDWVNRFDCPEISKRMRDAIEELQDATE